MSIPNPNTTFPLPDYDKLCFLKNIIKNPNIIVGDYTYYDDFDDVSNFNKNVKYIVLNNSFLMIAASCYLF